VADNKRPADDDLHDLHATFGLLGVVALAPVVLAASISVGARFALSTGAGLGTGIAVGLLVAAAMLAVSTLPGRRSGRIAWHLRPTASELSALALLGLLFVVLWDRSAFRSLSMPVLFGVDPAHHGALISYIVMEDQLPHADPRLLGLWNYPSGAHIVAAAVSRVFGLTPLTSMWLVALGAMGSVALLMAWICRIASPGASWLGAGVPMVVWLSAWRFGIGIVTSWFFFAQAVGLVFTLAGVGVCVFATRRRSPWAMLALAALFALASYWAYPQQAAVVPVAMLLSLPRGWLGSTRSLFVRRRGASLALIAALSLVVVGVAWLVVSSHYITLGTIAGGAEGPRIPVTAASIGGAAIVALALYSLVELVVATGRGNRQSRVLLGAMAIPALLAAGLAAMRLSLFGGVSVTQYRIVKNLYTAVPLVAIGIGFGACVAGREVADRYRRRFDASGRGIDGATRSIVSLTLAFISAIALAIRPAHLAGASTPLVDRGAYELAVASAGRSIAPDQIGVVGDGVGPYTLWWMGIRRAIPADSHLYPGFPSRAAWSTWPADGGERYLIVEAARADEYVSRPGVEVVEKRRGAVLLRRTDP
jgi:hypothetical protein